jgi:hypothetical protein
MVAPNHVNGRRRFARTPVDGTSPVQSAFLNQLANDLEAGKYVYVKAEDGVALPGMYD